VKKDTNPEIQYDFFAPIIRDISLKDQRETMERPFFSLSKRKRLKPIEYSSPDRAVWVRVDALPKHGMATIFDADILIWAVSVIVSKLAKGNNDVGKTITTTPYDLLKAIRRDTNGEAYSSLKAALDRLATTTVYTSIRASATTERRFSWLDSWKIETDAKSQRPVAITFTISDWVYEGIINDQTLLTLSPEYFSISGGLERVLYRMARKHAGSQRGGWVCKLSTLREKSGSDSPAKEFTRMIKKAVLQNELPDYEMFLVTCADGTPGVRFLLRDEALRIAVEAELNALPEISGGKIGQNDEAAMRIDFSKRRMERDEY
jgi:plasmid replication initiation protein